MSMHGSVYWRDARGLLSVALAVLGAVITIAQTLRGEVRPHPLTWFVFGVLSLTGYWVQRDQGARHGSWTLLAMTIFCALAAPCGERRKPGVRREDRKAPGHEAGHGLNDLRARVCE
jgi:hypothetical protein